MDIEISPARVKATCITEGIYSNALTYGNTYEIIAQDKQKKQVQIRGDNGRIRWYPASYFDMTARDVPELLRIVRHDSLENPIDWIEVEIVLSNHQHRWCYFITPELLSRREGTSITQHGRLLGYHTPHMIIVNVLDKDIIERTLRYIESQGVLLECTKLLENEE